jgi:DNA-binding SARP family transcriptional activator
MALSQIANELYNSFMEKSANSRVVLLHSDSHYRPVLLSQLLASPDVRVFYYAMSPSDIDTIAFVSSFTHEISEINPNFGNHVNFVGYAKENRSQLPAALAQDLAELNSDPFIMILDEFDQADIADDLQLFLEHLIDQLPANCKLVISSRRLPRLPWVALIAQNKAIMLRDTNLVADGFYRPTPEGETQVQVYGLGPGHVVLNGELINTWEGHLPRLLFFFTLDRPMVTRSEICRSFWTELETSQAVNVFHVTKRRLHKALEPTGHDILTHRGGYYRINPQITITYDIFDFVTALVEGRIARGADRAQAWVRAMEMYQHPYLQGHLEQWITKRRDEYLTGYLEAITNVARLRIEDGRPEQALNLMLKAVGENPTRQDLHREVMLLYTDLGRRGEAADHYRKLQNILRDNRIELEDATRRLYADLMSS